MTFRDNLPKLVTSLPEGANEVAHQTLPSRLSVFLLFLTAIASGCSYSTNMKVSRDDLGDTWPFTVDRGVIACNHPSLAVVFFTNEKIYAVNGVAKGQKRYADVREILRDDLSAAESKADIGPILDRGLKLCSRHFWD